MIPQTTDCLRSTYLVGGTRLLGHPVIPEVLAVIQLPVRDSYRKMAEETPCKGNLLVSRL